MKKTLPTKGEFHPDYPGWTRQQINDAEVRMAFRKKDKRKIKNGPGKEK